MFNIENAFIEIIADVLVVPVVLMGAWAILIVPKTVRYQVMARALMTGMTALFIAKIISLLYQGERPFVALGTLPKAAYLNNPGFPSDHALLVFTVTIVVWASTKNVKLSVWLLVLSCLVALGRILALVHTPADVAGGLFCAVTAGLLLYGKNLFTKRTMF